MSTPESSPSSLRQAPFLVGLFLVTASTLALEVLATRLLSVLTWYSLAFLVIAMVVTPGATAYLLTDRFPRLVALSIVIGTLTSAAGAYISFFLDGATGGVIICLQTALFLLAFIFAPKHGLIAARRRAGAVL